MKKYKVYSIILIIFLMITTISSTVLAWDLNSINERRTEDLDSFGNSIIKILTTIGMVASVIVLVVLGIKYMMGSVEEKASYKKTLMPYFIGAFLVFGASAIASMIYNVAISL